MRKTHNWLLNVVSTFLAVALLMGMSTASRADLMVNQDLGALPFGVTNISGDTSTGANNADYYATTTNPLGNWANELVYQFSLSTAAVVNLSLNSESSDTDFFFLSGLTTTFDGVKNAAQDDLAAIFLDGGPESLGLVPAGNYYLSAETFAGFDPPPGPFSSSFDLNIEVVESGPPPVFTDLGLIATYPAAFSLDTFGSDFDTELGAYNSSGSVVLTNDDAGGDLQSQLNFASGARPGEYYVALGGFNTTYGEGFVVTPGTSAGNFTLNYPTGSSAGALGAGELEWFRFEVDGTVTPPTDFIDLGTIASEGDPVTVDSFGSDFDTELGIYDEDGFLVAINDDAGGELQSEIEFLGGLAAGDYYVALGGFNTTYLDAFGAVPGGASGNWIVTANGVSQDGVLSADSIQWFRFQVVPEPAGCLLMLVGGLLGGLRRRSLFTQ